MWSASRWSKQRWREWKRQRREPLIPLTYRPGELAEVDFFEVQVDVAGRRQKAWLFVLRLMYSGRDVGWIYERQYQISFLDGHVRAFAHLGGVPARLACTSVRAQPPMVWMASTCPRRKLSSVWSSVNTARIARE